MVFHWSLSVSKSPQVSRTRLSILAVLNNVAVWMVSTRPPTSKSSSPFSNPLVTVLNAPITVGIIITFMFNSFFNSLSRSRYLSFFSHSFSFILWSAGTAKSTIFLLIIIRSGLLAEIRWSVCMSKSLLSLLFLASFSHQCLLMVFHWSLSDSKSPQFSWNLLIILANLNNAVIWMVLAHPLISNFFTSLPSFWETFQAH